MNLSLLRAVRGPGRRWPPEDSVALRVAAAASVVLGILACATQGELHPWFALSGAAAVVAGSVVSHRRRARPLPYLKSVLAAVMLAAFCWFLLVVPHVASAGYLMSVEGPLAVLFTTMQASHAFDMPCRRDLGFAIAGSATLVAVAAAQAVDVSFGLLVAAWAACCLAGMSASWSSMAGGAQLRPAGIALAAAAALAVAGLLEVALPAPRPQDLSGAALSRALSPGGPSSEPSHLVRPGPGLPARRAASADGPTGVGGFLGFAGPLDTALRPSLGNEVVLRVRADRPSYWLAETFGAWSGRSWTANRPSTPPPAPPRAPAPPSASTVPGPETSLAGHSGRLWEPVTQGPPFFVAPSSVGTGDEGPPGGPGTAAAADYQTFYLVAGSSDLVLHAEQATTLWVPTSRVDVAPDGTIRSATVLGPGSVYSVLSTVATAAPAQLERSSGHAGLTPATLAEALQLPHPYPRVAALARRVTARSRDVYAEVTALEHWMGTHTRYTTDIPPLAPGQDTVDAFLFGSRRGYCEQISTALAVMLRSLGIPAREAVGYVPGPYDPVTGLYDEQAKDAHAWVQVWFPGYGWQSFDPTADVPLATPSTGPALARVVLGALSRVPVIPTAPLGASGVLGAAGAWWWRRRPRTWHATVAREIERAARRAGVGDRPCATLGAVAAELDAAMTAPPTARGGPAQAGPHAPRGAGKLVAAAGVLAAAAEEAAWSGTGGGTGSGTGGAADLARAYVRDARRIRRAARRRTVRVRTARGASAPRRSSPRRRAGAGRP